MRSFLKHFQFDGIDQQIIGVVANYASGFYRINVTWEVKSQCFKVEEVVFNKLVRTEHVDYIKEVDSTVLMSSKVFHKARSMRLNSNFPRRKG